jgi:transposase-like protein
MGKYERLRKEIEETNYSAVGRKYGVSDNTIRKWIKFYKTKN